MKYTDNLNLSCIFNKNKIHAIIKYVDRIESDALMNIRKYDSNVVHPLSISGAIDSLKVICDLYNSTLRGNLLRCMGLLGFTILYEDNIHSNFIYHSMYFDYFIIMDYEIVSHKLFSEYSNYDSMNLSNKYNNYSFYFYDTNVYTIIEEYIRLFYNQFKYDSISKLMSELIL